MKRFWLLVAVLLFSSPRSDSFGQAPPAPTPAEKALAAAVDAEPTDVPSDLQYKQGHPALWLTMCKAQVAAAQGKPVDIIFIGDSITARWLNQEERPLWNQAYASRHALNFGVAADKTQNVLWRLENLDIKGFKPKVAVIMIGTNNGRNTVANIAKGVKAVVDKTKEVFPMAKIILVSITPSKYFNDTKMQVDAIIRTYADNSTVYYLDLVPLMPPVGDNWKGLSPDHLHPALEGYQIWHDAMEPLLSKLLAGTP